MGWGLGVIKQVAVNHTALMNMASRLEALGFQGDAFEVAEKLALNLLADGYRPLERVEVPPPSTSTPEARREALRASQAAIDAVKRKRTQRVDT